MTQHEMVRLIDGTYVVLSSRVVDGITVHWTTPVAPGQEASVEERLMAYAIPEMP